MAGSIGLRHVLAALHRGEVIVVDHALGARTAALLLADAKRPMAVGGFEAETAADPRLGPAMRALVERTPTLLDSFRYVAWHRSPPFAAYPATAAAMTALRALVTSLGDAEVRLSQPLSPDWSPTGTVRDPAGCLLSLVGFNGTRYALHTDANQRQGRQRKLTALYYPQFEPAWRPGDGGELRVLQANGSELRLAPRADRLVLFRPELRHEALQSRVARITMTVWGHGRGERLAAAPAHPVDLTHRCTSTMCQGAVRRTGAAADAADYSASVVHGSQARSTL